jgi:O-antigen ligase
MQLSMARKSIIEALSIGGFVGLLAGLWPLGVLPVIGIAAAFLLLLWYPPAGLGLLLTSRSSMDLFAHIPILPAPLELNAASTLGLLMILLAAFVLFLKHHRRQTIDWGGRPALLWAGWIAFAGLGVLVATLQLGVTGLNLGIRELVRLSSLLAVYLLVVNLVRSPAGRRVIVWALFLGLIAPAIAGFYQLKTGDVHHEVHGVLRLAGTFAHPNPFATYLVGILAIGVGFWRDLRPSAPRRFLLPLLLLVAIFLLVFTFSRSGFALLLCTFILWAWQGSHKRKLAVLSILVVIGVLAAPAITWRFQDLSSTSLAVDEDPTNSLQWRLQNYYMLYLTFLKSPVVGHGTHSISVVNPMELEVRGGYTTGATAHNELMRVLVEHGLIGALLYFAFGVLLLRALYTLGRDQRASAEGGHPGLGNALFCYTTALYVLSMLGTEFMGGTMVLYLIMSFVAVLHLGRRAGSLPSPHRDA